MKFKGLYLWIALPVAIIVVWLLAFYLPVASEIRDSAQRTLSLKSESDTTDNEIASASALIQRDRQIQQSFREFAAQVPQMAALPDFIRWVTKRAKDKGLSVSRVSHTLLPANEARDAVFLHPVLDVEVRGRFLEMGRFLDDLSQKFAFNSIVKARISYVERENPVVAARYVMELNIWREQHGAGK